MTTERDVLDLIWQATITPDQWIDYIRHGRNGRPYNEKQTKYYKALVAARLMGQPAPQPAPGPPRVVVQSVFQHLGAFVNIVGNCPESKVAAFAAAGGMWVVPLLAQLGYPDDHDDACVSNLAGLDGFRDVCARYGVKVGGWFNGWAGGDLATTADDDGVHVAQIVNDHKITGPVVLDLEIAYQYPVGRWTELPKLVAAVRARLPHADLAVSTNSPNDAMQWNGGDIPANSMYRLGVHLLPQWYNAPSYGGGTWMQPDQTMQWMQAHGAEGNLHDPQAPGGRAVPVDWIHGTLETTGLEGADLASELDRLRAAKQYGYAHGLSLYLLERAPDDDLKLCAQARGSLFL